MALTQMPRTNTIERGFFRLCDAEAKVPERKPKMMLKHPFSTSEFNLYAGSAMPLGMAMGMRMPMAMMWPGPARRDPVEWRGG